jgi:hypothetical protein
MILHAVDHIQNGTGGLEATNDAEGIEVKF